MLIGIFTSRGEAQTTQVAPEDATAGTALWETTLHGDDDIYIYMYVYVYIYMWYPPKPIHPLILLLFTVNSTYFGTYFSKAKIN